MAEDFVASFLALPGRDQRLQALQSLVEALSYTERNAVTAAISRRNDIVTALPIELTLSIFTYLDISDTWRLRSVSKAWCARLSGHAIEHSAVSRWNTHESLDREPAGEGRTLESEIRHIKAWQTGRPFFWRARAERSRIFDVHLKGHYLLYRHDWRAGDTNRDGSLTLQNLRTGALHKYRDEAREPVIGAVLTSKMMAYTTLAAGVMFWRRLDDPATEVRRARLPSAQIITMGGDEDLVILLTAAVQSRPTLGREVKSLLIFDTWTSHMRSVNLRWGPITSPEPFSSIWPLKILVRAKEQTIDMFFGFTSHLYEAPPQTFPRFRHVRVDFNGTIVSEANYDCSYATERSSWQWSVASGGNIGQKGLYRLNLVDGEEDSTTSILFDAAKGACVELEKEPMPKEGLCALWKGSVFFRRELDGSNATPPGSQLNANRYGLISEEDNQKRVRKEEVGGAAGAIARYPRRSVRAFNAMPVADRPSDLDAYTVNDSYLVVSHSTQATSTQAASPGSDVVRIFCFEEDGGMLAGGQRTGLWDQERTTT